jgi:hypothetical protein
VGMAAGGTELPRRTYIPKAQHLLSPLH